MSSVSSCGPKTPLQEYQLKTKEAGQPPKLPADPKDLLKEQAVAALKPGFTPDPKKILDIQA